MASLGVPPRSSARSGLGLFGAFGASGDSGAHPRCLLTIVSAPSLALRPPMPGLGPRLWALPCFGPRLWASRVWGSRPTRQGETSGIYKNFQHVIRSEGCRGKGKPKHTQTHTHTHTTLIISTVSSWPQPSTQQLIRQGTTVKSGNKQIPRKAPSAKQARKRAHSRTQRNTKESP